MAAQRGERVEVALGGFGVDLGGGAAGDGGDDAQPRAAERDVGTEPVEFAPRRRPGVAPGRVQAPAG